MKYIDIKNEDYDDVLDISKGIWDGDDYIPQVFGKWVNDKEGKFLGIQIDNKIVALGKYSKLKDNQGWLEGLRVHKDYRGLKLANKIADYLFDVAKKDLKENKIKSIAMCTHITTTESIEMMEARGFKLKDKCMIVSKELGDRDDKFKFQGHNIDSWDISYEEFKNLDIFKNNNNIVLGFTYYNLCREIYDDFIESNYFIQIDNYKYIVNKKLTYSIISIENTVESINLVTNYYLDKYKVDEVEVYIKNPKDELIQKLKNQKYKSRSNFNKDCLYYVYDNE